MLGDSQELPPDALPAPQPAEPARAKRTTCEFCECRLTPSGELLELGGKARQFRDHATKIEDLTNALSRETTRADTLKNEVARLRAELDKKKGFFS
jgi:hypothetical protein